MKIGVFGGSFDPVHLEHIEVAKAAISSLSLDKLIVMPAHVPPHKQDKILSQEADRLEMCKIAFSGIEKVEVSDYEIKKGGNSYTYLTCQALKEIYSKDELFFVVGTDMLRDFPTWKHPEKILECATLAVCARNENEGWLEKEKRDFNDRFDCDFALVQYNGKPVSSTKIRVFGAAGLDLTDFVGKKVNEYIKNKGLYAVAGAPQALALLKEERKAHTIAVALLSAELAARYKVPEKKAITAALFHDCAKYLSPESPLLCGFVAPNAVPPPVYHQYSGAYVAEHIFGVQDQDVLNAVRYHTSGRENMSALEKIVFLADMLEPSRTFAGVNELREKAFVDLDECMCAALCKTLAHLKENKKTIYPLTERAFEYYKRKEK